MTLIAHSETELIGFVEEGGVELLDLVEYIFVISVESSNFGAVSDGNTAASFGHSEDFPCLGSLCELAGDLEGGFSGSALVFDCVVVELEGVSCLFGQSVKYIRGCGFELEGFFSNGLESLKTDRVGWTQGDVLDNDQQKERNEDLLND